MIPMISHVEDLIATAEFFDRAIAEIAGLRDRKNIKILDFGCGAGNPANALVERGYDAYGCDVVNSDLFSGSGRLRLIAKQPQRMPFDDNGFDIVTSTSLLEQHA